MLTGTHIPVFSLIIISPSFTRLHAGHPRVRTRTYEYEKKGQEHSKEGNLKISLLE
jgi:hypothetical protein